MRHLSAAFVAIGIVNTLWRLHLITDTTTSNLLIDHLIDKLRLRK